MSHPSGRRLTSWPFPPLHPQMGAERFVSIPRPVAASAWGSYPSLGRGCGGDGGLCTFYRRVPWGHGRTPVKFEGDGNHARLPFCLRGPSGGSLLVQFPLLLLLYFRSRVFFTPIFRLCFSTNRVPRVRFVPYFVFQGTRTYSLRFFHGSSIRCASVHAFSMIFGHTYHNVKGHGFRTSIKRGAGGAHFLRNFHRDATMYSHRSTHPRFSTTRMSYRGK